MASSPSNSRLASPVSFSAFGHFGVRTASYLLAVVLCLVVLV